MILNKNDTRNKSNKNLKRKSKDKRKKYSYAELFKQGKIKQTQDNLNIFLKQQFESRNSLSMSRSKTTFSTGKSFNNIKLENNHTRNDNLNNLNKSNSQNILQCSKFQMNSNNSHASLKLNMLVDIIDEDIIKETLAEEKIEEVENNANTIRKLKNNNIIDYVRTTISSVKNNNPQLNKNVINDKEIPLLNKPSLSINKNLTKDKNFVSRNIYNSDHKYDNEQNEFYMNDRIETLNKNLYVKQNPSSTREFSSFYSSLTKNTRENSKNKKKELKQDKKLNEIVNTNELSNNKGFSIISNNKNILKNCDCENKKQNNTLDYKKIINIDNNSNFTVNSLRNKNYDNKRSVSNLDNLKSYNTVSNLNSHLTTNYENAYKQLDFHKIEFEVENFNLKEKLRINTPSLNLSKKKILTKRHQANDDFENFNTGETKSSLKEFLDFNQDNKIKTNILKDIRNVTIGNTKKFEEFEKKKKLSINNFTLPANEFNINKSTKKYRLVNGLLI